MSVFTDAEIAYLSDGERRLARVATIGPDDMPHIAPVGMWSYNPEHDSIDVTGRDFARTKKFRDVERTGKAAFVVDEVLPPWRPRGIEVRGTAEALHAPKPLIRIHPQRIVGWGLDATDGPNARTVSEHAR